MTVAQPSARKRLHDYIDTMLDYGLPIVEPILAHFADEPLIIETDLTAEEKADIAEERKLHSEHPEEFISLKQFLAQGVT
jgi:DNA-binding LacI/PurR family transcriptional regulator